MSDRGPWFARGDERSNAKLIEEIRSGIDGLLGSKFRSLKEDLRQELRRLLREEGGKATPDEWGGTSEVPGLLEKFREDLNHLRARSAELVRGAADRDRLLLDSMDEIRSSRAALDVIKEQLRRLAAGEGERQAAIQQRVLELMEGLEQLRGDILSGGSALHGAGRGPNFERLLGSLENLEGRLGDVARSTAEIAGRLDRIESVLDELLAPGGASMPASGPGSSQTAATVKLIREALENLRHIEETDSPPGERQTSWLANVRNELRKDLEHLRKVESTGDRPPLEEQVVLMNILNRLHRFCSEPGSHLDRWCREFRSKSEKLLRERFQVVRFDRIVPHRTREMDCPEHIDVEGNEPSRDAQGTILRITRPCFVHESGKVVQKALVVVSEGGGHA